MKYALIFKIINQLRTQPKLLRKVKVIMAVGGFISLGVLVLAIMIGVSSFNFVATKTENLLLASQKTNLPSLKPLECWNKALSLVGVEPWLTKPMVDNFTGLKMACIESPPTKCEAKDCGTI